MKTAETIEAFEKELEAAENQRDEAREALSFDQGFLAGMKRGLQLARECAKRDKPKEPPVENNGHKPTAPETA